MGNKNHLIFTQKLLKLCHLDEKAAYFPSLFSFVRQERIPNNLFTQPLSHLPDMLEVAIHVLTVHDEQARDKQKTLKYLDTDLN